MSFTTIGDAARPLYDRITVAAPAAEAEDLIVLETGNAPLYLTRKEAADIGLRWLGSGERRRWQVALCRDASTGEFVYGPLKQRDESPEQIFTRAREERRLMNERCTRPREERRGLALPQDLGWTER